MDSRFYTDHVAAHLVGMLDAPEWSRFLDFCRQAGFGRLADPMPGGNPRWLVPESVVQEIVQETAKARGACLDAIIQRMSGQEVRHGC